LGVLLRAATRALADQHMSVVLTMNSGPVDRDRIVRHVRGGHVDGVLLVSTHGDDPLFSQLEAAGIPTVICGRALRPHSALPCVWPDDRGGARQMAEHLVERGYDRITMISGPADTASAVDRIAGFRDVLGRRISKRLIVEAPRYSHGAGEATMAALLEREPTTDAVFVASDLLAAGAINTLRRSGRRVPDDVAVGGFDDSRIALTTDPPLTTIQVPFEAMAEAMVRLITQLITGIEVSSVQFPTQLVVRDSA
jgi:DNA-binding LacI/PurR family transcriptional regulator